MVSIRQSVGSFASRSKVLRTKPAGNGPCAASVYAACKSGVRSGATCASSTVTTRLIVVLRVRVRTARTHQVDRGGGAWPRLLSDTGAEWLADLPVMTEGVDEASRCTAQGLRDEVLMRWRLVGYPELRAVHCELRHHRAAILDLEQFSCTERRLVELHGIGAAAHREHRREADDGSVRTSWHA